MPRFHYTAIGEQGKRTKGTVTAESPYAARKQLRMRGIHPTDVNQVKSRGEKGGFSFLKKRTKKSDLIDFTKQMSTLLNSGIKLTEALGVLAIQINSPRFKNAVTDIRDRVITGESFAETLKDYPDFFDVIFISMIRVGEMTGNLGEVLSTIAAFMEKRQKVESKLTTAMIYPAALVFFCIFAIIVLATTIIPKIGEQIAQTGRELPWLTKQMMNFSHILTSWWALLLIAGLFAIGWSFKKFVSTDKGRHIRDTFILSVPGFGPLLKQRIVARFAATLSTLLSSGLPMAESLRVVSETTGNSIMKEAIKSSRERILSGADIATPLRDSGVISPAIAHMVTVGEKSGELEVMLRNIALDLESNTDVVIERLMAMVEPIIIVFMALMVGLIAIATILPILEVSSGSM